MGETQGVVEEMESNLDNEFDLELGLDMERDEEPGPAKEPEPEPEVEAEETGGNDDAPTPIEDPETPSEDEEPEPLAASGELSPEAREKLKKQAIELRRLKREADAKRAAEPKVEQPPKPKIGPGIAIDETGERVGLNAEEFESGIRQHTSSIQQEIEALKKQQQIRDFITKDPAHAAERQAVFSQADEAYEVVMAHIENAQAVAGVPIQSVGQAVAHLENSGVAEQIRQAYPTLAPMWGEFVGASVTGDGTWQLDILDRAARAATAQKSPSAGPIPQQQLKSVSDAPKSLARRGGGRSVDEGTDAAEFKRLEARVLDAEAIFDVTDEEMQRYRVLGKRLGVDGL